MYATDSRGPALVMRARNAVGAAFGALPVEVPDHPDLWLPGATFVTLHTAGLLHGCIGSLEATRSLAEDVQANAIAAAFHDPRFQPLTAREFSNTRFEVSVLGPASPVAAASEDEAIAALVYISATKNTPNGSTPAPTNGWPVVIAGDWNIPAATKSAMNNVKSPTNCAISGLLLFE